jgi:hypothetical protein
MKDGGHGGQWTQDEGQVIRERMAKRNEGQRTRDKERRINAEGKALLERDVLRQLHKLGRSIVFISE